MKRTILLLAVLSAFASMTARAAWYWPFGVDEDSPDSKPRLHRLLENANDLIEQAEDAALDGDAEKALELYNSALTNLVDVAEKNPDRADKPEFAPLRNKIAATSAAMDSIRFSQVEQNVRAVAVTDTTELQRKYDEEQARKKGVLPTKKADAGRASAPATAASPGRAVAPATAADAGRSSAPATAADAGRASAPATAASPGRAVAPATAASPGRAVAPATAVDAGRASAPATAVDSGRAVASPPVDGFDEKMQTAIREIRAKDYAAADLLLEDLEKERRNDLNVLILRSAAQSGLKYYLAARRTLEKAMRAHPKSYLPYYNLAHLMFAIPGEGRESARQYYELGRALGGPRDARLEGRLK